MEYVEQRNGGYYIAGTRISLDSVVYAYLRGEEPQQIEDSYPGCITRGQISWAIEFYAKNKSMVDEYLRQQKREFDQMARESRDKNPELYAKLDAARRAKLAYRH